MFNFIKPQHIEHTARLTVVNFKQIHELMNDQVFKIHNHYREQNILLPNEHPLSVIFDLIAPSMHCNLEDLVDNVNERVAMIAKRFDYYHLYNTNAAPQNGLFYHKGVKEYIYLDETYFDVNLCYERWDKVAPIKVHSHPFTDNNFTICNGLSDSSETGSATIIINLAMLMVQWRGWLNSSESKDKSIRNFLFNYPILNMLKAHTDLCVINRTINMVHGKPVAPYKREHQILTVDFNTLLDNAIAKQIKQLLQRKRNYNELFVFFETYFKHNWFDYIHLRNIPPMRNTRWVLTINNLRYTHFYLTCYENDWLIDSNRYLTGISRDINTLRQDKNIAYLDNPSREMWDDCLRIIQNFK